MKPKTDISTYKYLPQTILVKDRKRGNKGNNSTKRKKKGKRKNKEKNNKK
jgi:hypothetical protein